MTKNTIETIEIPKLEYDNMLLEIERYQQLVELLKSQLNNRNKQIFGSKSEKMDGQITLFEVMGDTFDEVEAVSEETTVIEVKTHKRVKIKGKKELDIESLPVLEEIVNDITDKACESCGEEVVKTGESILKEIIVIPAQVGVRVVVTPTYECLNCSKEPEISAEAPKPLIKNSNASAELLAYAAVQKYDCRIPLYKLETIFSRAGYGISRQTLANLMMNLAAMLTLFVDKLWLELTAREVINADETTVQVHNEEGRKDKTKSYMNVCCTGGADFEKPLALYHYTDGRSSKKILAKLRDYSGFVVCDGYAGYNALTNQGATLCGCWAHARRKFVEAYEADKNPENPALKAIALIKELYKIEREYAGFEPEKIQEREKMRLEKSKPIVVNLIAWAENLTGRSHIKPRLQKALTYLLNQKTKLMVFLNNGMVDIDNNRAERSIKPFVMGRKNWLFCGCPKGADASALIYSLIETAKLNKLDPFKYLTFLLKSYQNNNDCFNSDCQHFLPWNVTL